MPFFFLLFYSPFYKKSIFSLIHILERSYIPPLLAMGYTEEVTRTQRGLVNT